LAREKPVEAVKIAGSAIGTSTAAGVFSYILGTWII